MTCPKCNTNTIYTHPFIRMNEKGVDGIFWCEPCCEEHEPELYSNEKDDETDVEKNLKDIFYGSNPIEPILR